MNIQNIAKACGVECERQQVGLRELGFLIDAYQGLLEKQTDWASCYPDRGCPLFEGDIESLGSFVEPGKNRHGFRKIPVTFQNGGSSANASDVPRLIESLVNHISETQSIDDRREDARALTRQFLWIHPFVDGNGRVGFLLWNFLNGTLDDPTPLPDFDW